MQAGHHAHREFVIRQHLAELRFADGAAPTPLQALIRTLLLCTVIFAITYDENGRGVHERLSGTYLVKV